METSSERLLPLIERLDLLEARDLALATVLGAALAEADSATRQRARDAAQRLLDTAPSTALTAAQLKTLQVTLQTICHDPLQQR